MVATLESLDLPDLTTTIATDHVAEREQILQAQREHWMARIPFGYLVTHHTDCMAVLRDPRWHSAAGLIAQMAGVTDERYLERQQRPSILSVDGDVHTRLRRLVSPAFTPRGANRLRPFMRNVLSDLVDNVAEDGRCDLVTDVCEPYPIPIICELLGAPKDDWPLFSRLATSIFKVFNADLADHVDEVMAASLELDAYVDALIDDRRENPREDLLSDLIAVEEEGDRLDRSELVMLAEAVLLAGTDTTRNQLACAVAVFADHPDQWAMLAEQPELAPRATEEVLRYLGAVRGTGRIASEDIVYRDVHFPQGTLVFPSFTAANRDPDSFETPASFDITAERSDGHLTLGFGAHYCLGANLARAEMQEALPLLAQRMPNVAIDGDVTWKPTGVGIWGPEHLPITFDPGH